MAILEPPRARLEDGWMITVISSKRRREPSPAFGNAAIQDWRTVQCDVLLLA